MYKERSLPGISSRATCGLTYTGQRSDGKLRIRMLTNKLPTGAEPVGREAVAQRGLFIVWARARHLQDEILADLRGRFRITSVRDIHWSPRLITANFQRFYSDLDLRGVYHRLNKGDGPFLAIAVVDDTPEFDIRETGRGRRQVLSRFMDAKSLYRDWSGGIGIHCGETAWETERDLCMLFGIDETARPAAGNASWDGSIPALHRDLTGAGEWQSSEELFGILNRATRYVAINYVDDDLPGAAGREIDIDILTTDYYAAHTVLDSGRFPRLKFAHGGRVPVRLGRRRAAVGLRFPGDDYFDEAWARRLLDNRVLDDRGFYRLPDEEIFWVLAYHGLMHEPRLGEHMRQRLLSMAVARGLTEWEACLREGGDTASMRMRSLLAARGISCPEPLDRAVVFRHGGYAGRKDLKYAAQRCAGAIDAARRAVGSRVQAAYWPLRDGLLLRAPWLRKVKHWRRTLT